jgi:hypothetical protein
MNSTALLAKGLQCLTNELGILEAEEFIFTLLSQPFDYTEWRKNNLLADKSVVEISAAADKYCKENIR